MKTRSTAVLLIVFLGGLLALWWTDHARLPTAEQRRRWSGRVLPQLLDVPSTAIRRVEIGGGAGRLVFDRRDGNRWQMTAPLDALADGGRVDALVTNLRSLSIASQAMPIEGSSSRFGLVPPAHTIRLFGTDTRTPLATLEVGRAIQDRRYVRGGPEGPIEVVDAKLLGSLDGPVVDWRERSLFPVFSFDVQGLAVRGPGRALKAQRTERGWRLTEPFQAPADEQKLDSLLADLTGLQVADGTRGFVANDARNLERYGLLEPTVLTIELTTRSSSGNPLVLDLGAAVPGEPGRIYARHGDQDDVVKVDGRVLTSLGANPIALRSAKVVELEPGKAEFIRVTSEGLNHDLAKAADGWHVLTPAAGKADTRAVHELLSQLDALRAVADPEAKALAGGTGLDQPAVAISVWEGAAGAANASSAAAKPTRRPDVSLRIGRLDRRRNVAYAQTEGDPSILTLPETVRSLFPKGELAYRDRVLLSLPLGAIDRIEVASTDRTVEVVSSARPGEPARWRMVRPVQAAADAASLARLEPMLSRLRAESLVIEAAKDLQSYGLDHAEMSIHWTAREAGSALSTVVPPGEPYSLFLGAFVPDSRGSRFATLGGNPHALVFTLSPEALGILGAELHSHTVLSFPDNQVARVALGWPNRSVSLTREERAFVAQANWKPAPGLEDSGLDGEHVEALVKAVSNLSTPRFEQYTGPIPGRFGLMEPRFRVEVQLSGRLGTRAVRLGADGPAGTVYATAEIRDTGAVFLLPTGGWMYWLNPPVPSGGLPADVFAPAVRN